MERLYELHCPPNQAETIRDSAVRLLKVDDSQRIGPGCIVALAALLLMAPLLATPIYGQVIDVLGYARYHREPRRHRG